MQHSLRGVGIKRYMTTAGGKMFPIDEDNFVDYVCGIYVCGLRQDPQDPLRVSESLEAIRSLEQEPSGARASFFRALSVCQCLQRGCEDERGSLLFSAMWPYLGFLPDAVTIPDWRGSSKCPKSTFRDPDPRS